MIRATLILLIISHLIQCEIRFKKVYYGKQMQMMTYMDIALQNAQRLGLSNEIKRGLLYFHVHDERLSFKDWENWKMML